MKRAKLSANRPNISGSYSGRLTSWRLVSRGTSSRGAREEDEDANGVRRPAWRSSSRTSSRAMSSSLGGGDHAGLDRSLLPPVLGEDVVEHVVDRHDAEQVTVLVDD